MKYPLPMAEIPLRIPVGNHSDGSVVELDLHEVCPLFITHPDKKSWHPFLRNLINSIHLRSDLHWFVYLDREGIDNLMPELGASGSLQTFVTDDPESGTFKNRKHWIRSLMNAVKKRSGRMDKKKSEHYICIIDDIWDLIRRSTHSDAKKIQQIIRNTPSSNLRIIAGSSAGHRSLFPELLADKSTAPSPAQTRKQMPVNPKIPGTELIFGTEGLIFGGQPGGHSLEKWYAPIHWLSATITMSKEETTPKPAQHLKIHPSQTQDSLPENAELFSLELEGSMPLRHISS